MSLKKFILNISAPALVGYVAGKLIGETEGEKKRLSTNLALLGGAGGLSYFLLTHEEADTVNYTYYHKGKRGYEGITYEDRLNTRMSEHRASGKVFDKVIISELRPRSKARQIEINRIKRHNPKNNIKYICW